MPWYVVPMKRAWLLALVTIGAAGSVLSACSSESSGDEAPICFDYSGYDGASPAVSFKADVLPIMSRSCGLSGSCHGGGASLAQGFFAPSSSDGAPTAAEATAMFDALYGTARHAQGMARVKPGAPAESFLMYKLDGDFTCAGLTCADDAEGCGDTMPQGSHLLALSERDTIRRWIAQGAVSDL